MLTEIRRSTKPEDAVYALLGLIPDLLPALDRIPGASVSSRDNNLFQLYLGVFQHCLDKEQTLAILSAAGRYKGNSQAENWPSWLPDWRQQLPLRPLVLSNPSTLGPESAFDEDLPSSHCPAAQVAITPLYTLQVNPAAGSFSQQDQPSMIVQGVRLGCIVTRPFSWPACFLVADSIGQSLLESSHYGTGKDNFSQPLAALMPSLTTILPRSQTMRVPMVKQTRQNYSTDLIRHSLQVGAGCHSVRTSAMIETGDWLCAFRGGSVLYAIRPLDEYHMSDPNGAKATILKKEKRNVLSQSPVTSPGNLQRQVIRYLFLGECAVHGLNPSEALEEPQAVMGFELV